MMDAEERARLRELIRAATLGPWDRVETLHAESAVAVQGFERTRIVARVMPIGSSYGKDDAEFIAAARTTVPALLDALDAAEAKLAEVRQIAFDADMIAALEYGRVGSPPNVDGPTQGEALGYAVNALRDIRAALDGDL